MLWQWIPALVLPSTGSGLVGKMQHKKYHATQVTMPMLNAIFRLVGVVLNVAKIIKVRHGLKLYMEEVSEESFLPISPVERTNCSSPFVSNRKMCAKIVNLAGREQNTSTKLEAKFVKRQMIFFNRHSLPKQQPRNLPGANVGADSMAQRSTCSYQDEDVSWIISGWRCSFLCVLAKTESNPPI